MSNNVWQISGGPQDRSFADVFVRYGVGLIGPGDAGPWRSDRDDDEFEGSYARRFATEVQRDDVFLLRLGTSRVAAVGIVASDYSYLNQFDDVNGWDLQHARRVRWFPLPQIYDFGQPVFGANPRRFSSVAHREILDYVHRFMNSPPSDWQMAALPNLPVEEPLAPVTRYLEDIAATVQDLAGNFYWNRESFGDHPSEDEIIAHLIVPFLRALGWPPEQIAVKWRYIDVAIFSRLPRIPENCFLVIEAKQLGAGVEGALDQARGYVKALGVTRDVVVADGARYRLYSGEHEFKPVAYANFLRLKQSGLDLIDRLKRR
jgi:hypothetical protein